jgi:hypothetical protein
VTNGEFDNSTYAARCDADDAGRFHFPAQQGPYQLAILHPSGFAYLKSADRPIANTIALTAWAKVEGVFRIGSKPIADVPHIFTHQYVNSGAEGRFAFERVFPGNGRIGRHLILFTIDGAQDVTSSVMMAAHFPAGKTTHINLGGSGRRVVGKMAAPAGSTGKVLWQFALIDAHLNVPLPPRPPIPIEIERDPQRRKAWLDKWKETAQGKAWQAAYQLNETLRSSGAYISATIDRDGSFHVDDVPPGPYILNVSFSEHPAGHLSNVRFSVPEISGTEHAEPIDLGVLTLERQ